MSKKRKIRCIYNVFLTIIISLVFYSLMITGMYWFGLYRGNILNESISDTEYLDKRYEEFALKAREMISQANLPENLLDDEEVYQRFVTDLKKSILGNQSQDSGQWLKQYADEKIREYLNAENLTLTEAAETGVAALTANLQRAEKQYTAIPEMEQWYTAQMNFQKEARTAAVITGGVLAAAVVILFGVQHRKFKAFYCGGIGCAAASVVYLGTIAYIRHKYIDSAMTEIAGNYWRNVTNTGLYIGIAGIAISASLFMAGKLWHKMQQ